METMPYLDPNFVFGEREGLGQCRESLQEGGTAVEELAPTLQNVNIIASCTPSRITLNRYMFLGYIMKHSAKSQSFKGRIKF